MHSDDIYNLHILEELERGPEITQRGLASRLEVSLGLVNSFMKRLAKKGYFKVTTIPGNRVRYLLTPQGLAEKSRLTMEYLEYSLGYYRRVRAALGQRVRGLEAAGVRRVCLVGTGELAELAYLTLREHGLEVAAVAAGPGEAAGHFLGREVSSLEDLDASDCPVVLLALAEGAEKTRRLILELGLDPERVHDLRPESLA